MAKVKRKAKGKAEASISALSKAKSVYAKRGNVNSCGNWMAEALQVFRTENGDFDLKGFALCLNENGIERRTLIWTGTARVCRIDVKASRVKAGFHNDQR